MMANSTLDVDRNGTVDAGADGVLLLRMMQGMTGASVPARRDGYRLPPRAPDLGFDFPNDPVIVIGRGIGQQKGAVRCGEG